MAIADGEFADAANISDDQLLKIKQYMLKSHQQSIEENSYWLSVLHMYDKFGQNMNAGYVEAVESLTPASIAAFVSTYVLPANRIQLEMSPAN